MVLPVLAVILAGVLFGTTGTAQAIGPAGTTPLSLGVMRLAIGGTALALIVLPLARMQSRQHRMAGPSGRRSTRLFLIDRKSTV